MNEIYKILDKNYIKRVFEKKKDFYFPSLKDKKIIDLQIKKDSPAWAENSCLARYKIIFSDSTHKIIRGASHVDGSKKRSFKILNALYQRSLMGNFFKIPKPLDYLEKTKTLLYEETEGMSLSLLLEKRKPELIENIFEKIAQFLFSLHSIEVTKSRAKMFSLRDYGKIFWQIKKILPEFSQLILPLKKIAFLEKLKKPSTFLHGDFYPSNIIIDEDKIALIDFDKAGRGSFFVDLLSFIYWFDLPKIQSLKLSLREIEKIKGVFLKNYCQLARLDFLKTKKELEKFKLKIFLDCLHHVTILAYYGWEKIDKNLKREFKESLEFLLRKIKDCL